MENKIDTEESKTPIWYTPEAERMVAQMRLLPYQLSGVQHVVEILKRQRAFLLADEPGLGKTCQALSVARVLGATTLLVICPASVVSVWQREVAAWLDASYAVTILSYATAAKATERAGYDLVILDESHYLKTPTSARTKAVLDVVAPLGRRVLFLSGTPMPNCPIELQSVFGFIRADLFGDYWQFAKRYCAARQKRIPMRSVNGFRQSRLVWDVKGASNLDELRRLSNAVMLRRRKSEVLRELPAKWYSRYDVRLRGHEMRRPEGIERMTPYMLAQLEQDDSLAAARKSLALAKAAPVAEYIMTLLEGGMDKVVVYGWHVDALETFLTYMEDMGIGTVSISGKTPVGQRGDIVATFQTDPKCRIFCGNILAAGTGITLTAASTVVFLERDWVPANNLQAEDRCHRVGQRDNVSVIHTHVGGSVDDIVFEVLMRKEMIARQLETGDNRRERMQFKAGQEALK